MAKITLESRDLGVVLSGLEKLSKAQRRGILNDVGDMQVNLIVTKRMKSREGHDGKTYPASKRAMRDGGDTLWDKGDMLGSLKANPATDYKVEWNVSERESEKAVWAQFGTKRTVKTGKGKGKKKQHTPPRPIFGISENDATALLKKIAQSYENLIKDSGLG